MSVLSPQDLRELTDCARPSGQIDWLREQGWSFTVSHTGRPKVDRAEYERHMIGGKKNTKRAAEPDLEWFNGQETEEEQTLA
jgi:hypothetical protein